MFTAVRQVAARVRAFFRTANHDRDFEQELESHVAMLTDDNIRRGMPPAEARRAAHVRVGAGALLKEQHRDARGLPALELVLQDLRHTSRGLTRAPAFTLVAVATLA